MGIFDKKPTQEIVEEKEVDIKLQDPFAGKNNITAHNVMQSKKELLTFMGSWRHNNLESKEAEKQLAELTRKVISAQTQYLEHQLTVGLDKRKKEDYALYLTQIQKINENIVTISAQAALKLRTTRNDIAEQVYVNDAQERERLQRLLREGTITQEQHDEEIELLQISSKALREQAGKMASTVIENSMKTFDITIELFDGNVLPPTI